ncbi:secreted RxLR effector protein 161-like [Apium graveolens]|uniref:secreted RxLR effector protein 161-like n=1 Tax=Apium graveolens TaxID=4045 RepID=UPI003D7985B1
MEQKVQLHKDGKLVNPTTFKSMVGGLRYLVHTRPDISYSVGVVSRFMEKPTTLHLNAAKRILRYVKGILNYGLIYKKGQGDYLLAGYSDSDLAGNIDNRRSTGGMTFYLDESLITWVSHKQRCVVLSSCEAEFMAATATTYQGIWLQKVLNYIFEVKVGPGTIVVKHVKSIEQKADILTKVLRTIKFENMRKLLGVRNLQDV